MRQRDTFTPRLDMTTTLAEAVGQFYGPHSRLVVATWMWVCAGEGDEQTTTDGRRSREQ